MSTLGSEETVFSLCDRNLSLRKIILTIRSKLTSVQNGDMSFVQ